MSVLTNESFLNFILLYKFFNIVWYKGGKLLSWKSLFMHYLGCKGFNWGKKIKINEHDTFLIWNKNRQIFT